MDKLMAILLQLLVSVAVIMLLCDGRLLLAAKVDLGSEQLENVGEDGLNLVVVVVLDVIVLVTVAISHAISFDMRLKKGDKLGCGSVDATLLQKD